MKVGVVGASGYVGGELLWLLVAHPKIWSLVWSYQGRRQENTSTVFTQI